MKAAAALLVGSVAAFELTGCKACERDARVDPSSDGTPIDVSPGITPAMAPAARVPEPDAGPRIKPTCTDSTASLEVPEGLYGGGAFVGSGEKGALFVAGTSAAKPPMHGVLRAAASLASSRFVSVTHAHGDEPPPELAVDRSVVYLAAYSSFKPRTLAVARIDGTQDDGAPTLAPFDTWPVDEDESYGFGIAAQNGRALVVWDGEQRGRGVILGRFAPGGGGGADAGAATVLSASDDSALTPAVVATARGFFVAWLVEQAPPQGIVDGGGSLLEGPGENAAYRTLHGRFFDAKGAPDGAEVRMGHTESEVLSFELARDGEGASVVAVDRRVRGNTASTRLVRYAVVPGATAKSEEWASERVGNAGVAPLGDLTFFSDDRDRAMVVFGSQPRAEPKLDGTSALAQDGASVFVLRTRTRGFSPPKGGGARAVDGGITATGALNGPTISLERLRCPPP